MSKFVLDFAALRCGVSARFSAAPVAAWLVDGNREVCGGEARWPGHFGGAPKRGRMSDSPFQTPALPGATPILTDFYRPLPTQNPMGMGEWF